MAGVDAVVHLAEFDPLPRPGLASDVDVLEHASLGTYRLFGAAREAGVERVVLVGWLSFFDAYPPEHLIDEMWRPRPDTAALHLAPYVAELVGREFCREGGSNAVCLRFLPIGDGEENTSPDDVKVALDRALALRLETPGYRWQVFHIASSPRFILRNARLGLGFVGREC